MPYDNDATPAVKDPHPPVSATPTQKAGMWVYLMFLLLLAIRCLTVIWPHSIWIEAWYGSEARRQAAYAVMEKTRVSLHQSRQLLAEFEGAPENPLTGAQLVALNAGLGNAVELINMPAAGKKEEDKAASQTGPISNQPQPDPSPPKESPSAFELRDQVPAVGRPVPTAKRIGELNQLLSRAEKCLDDHLNPLRTPVHTPTFWQMLSNQLPDGRCYGTPSTFNWRPLLSESAEYASSLAQICEKNPPVCANSSELHYFFIVLLFGVIGGTTQALLSLVLYTGTRALYTSWIMHYLTMPWAGGSLAAAVYTLFRGGFLNMNVSAADTVNIYTFSGLGVLVGLSTQQVTEKIKDLAEEIFSKKDAIDKAPSASPASNDSNPPSDTAGTRPSS